MDVACFQIMKSHEKKYVKIFLPCVELSVTTMVLTIATFIITFFVKQLKHLVV